MQCIAMHYTAGTCLRALAQQKSVCLSLFSLQAKIEAIACGTYGAAGVSYSPEAEAAIEHFTAMGYDKLPICMAKTQYSFSHDATLKGGLHSAW